MGISTFNYNFRQIKRCFDFDFEFRWFGEDGAGLNLLGSQTSVNIWDKKRENILITMTTTVIAENPGHTLHALSKVQTEALVAGDYPYELALIEPDGNTYCYMDGIMPFVDFTSP